MQSAALPPQPLSETLSRAIERGCDIAGCRFTGGDAGRQDLYGLGLEQCVFSGCRLTGCDFSRTTLSHVRFEQCDLSGVHFDDAGLHHVQLVDCRGLGLHAFGALWDDVAIQGGVYDYVNLHRSQWKQCTLSASFRDAALTALTVRKCRVDGSDFTRADWTGAHIAGLDFSGAAIEGARFSQDGLRDVVVSREQAAELARLLGLIIRP